MRNGNCTCSATGVPFYTKISTVGSPGGLVYSLKISSRLGKMFFSLNPRGAPCNPNPITLITPGWFSASNASVSGCLSTCRKYSFVFCYLVHELRRMPVLQHYPCRSDHRSLRQSQLYPRNECTSVRPDFNHRHPKGSCCISWNVIPCCPRKIISNSPGSPCNLFPQLPL